MANQIVVSAGAKVRNLSGVLTATSGVVSFLPIDVSMGIPQLDVNGKILVSQLPNSVMEYKGTWSAATNTPTLVNGTGNQGDVYLCNVAGTVNFGAGAIAFFVGDQVIYSGSIWQRASGATGTVTSVAVTETGDSLNITGSPITTSGTINIGFNGTNLQYVNGAGNLTTFPILTGYVPYTGATQDVDLGAFSLNGKSLHIKGTAGNGHLGLKHQSAAATGSANESLIYADSLGDLSWQNANLYLSKFITSANTANRSYTFPNATCNIPDDSLVVHLAGTETITGAKTFSGYTTFTSTVDITSGLTFSNSGFTLVLQPPTLSVNRTVTLPNGTGTLALTSDISYPVTSVFGRTGAVVATSGDYTTTQVTEGTNLYFTDSRARLALSLTTTGTSGAATYNNTTGVFNIPNYAPDLSGYVTLAGTQTITGAKTFSTYSKFDGGVILKNNVSASLAGYIGLSAYSASGNKGINIDFDTYSASFYFSGTLPYQYTFPAASGTIALVGGSGVGTVTSVAALTIGTTGTDLSSSVANSTTTPVITLNVPTASATNRGALSSADWTTFNNKQSALTNPVTGTGTTNYLPKFTGTSTIGNSAIYDNGGNIGIGTTSASAQLHLYGGNSGVTAPDSRTRLRVESSGEAYISMNVPDNSYTGFRMGTPTNSVGAYIEYEGSTGNTSFITIPNAYLRFGTASTERLRIFGNGNIVMGQSSPTDSGYKLDVNGTGRFSDAVTIRSSSVSSGGSAINAYGFDGAADLYTTRQENPYNAALYLHNNPISGQGYGTGILFRAKSDTINSRVQGNIYTTWTTATDASRTSKMVFSTTNSGTTSDKLTIEGTGAATFSSSVTATSESSLFKEGFRINATTTGGGGSQPAYTYYTAAGSKRWSTFLNVGDDKFHIANASNSELFTITQGGNVGIGTSSPQRILTVYNSNAATLYQTPTSGTGASDGFYVGQTSDVSYVWNYNSFPLVFGTANTERMRITSGGVLQVANGSGTLGTIVGSERLNVNGDVYAYGAATFSSSIAATSATFSSSVKAYSATTLASLGQPAFMGTGEFMSTSTSAGYFMENRSGGVTSTTNWAGWYYSGTTIRMYNGSADIFSMIASTGAATFSSSVTATSFFESSDSRLKTLIQDNYQTKGIASITPKLYTKNGKVELGYYAQDFVGILDSAVSKGSDDMLSLSYREVLVAKVYALEQRIKELENK